MTATQLIKQIGSTAYIVAGGLKVAVRIVDAKECWGKTRYLVEPVTGSGSAWVENIIQKEVVK